MPAWLIPAIISAVGIGADLLRQRAQGQSAETQQNLYNQWLRDRQSGAQDIIAQLTAGGFNPFGPQVNTGTNSSTTSGTTRGTTNSTTRTSTRPVVTPEYSKLEGMFRGLLEGRLAKPSALPHGFAETGALAINKAHAGASAAARNMAARRGLSAEASFGLAAPGESARATDIGKFLVDVPLKERQLQTEDIELASRVAQIFGLGHDQVSNTQGTTTSASNSSTSGMSSMASPPNIGMLANLLLPPGPMQGGGTGQSGVGTGMAGVSQLLAWLYQQGMLGGSGHPGGGGGLPPPTTGQGGIF